MNFPLTNWTQLRQATLNGDKAGQQALATLCENYRAPILGFLRMRGYDSQAAEDLTQQLFLELIEHESWRRADQAKGRFRTFLLGILNFVLSRQRRHLGAEKRGPGQSIMSLDLMAEEGWEPAGVEMEEQFDAQWALGLVAGALATVQQGFLNKDKGSAWEILVRFLPGSGGPPTYEEAAAALGYSLAATKSAVNRVRTEFREELRRAVSLTVGAPHEITEELAYLREVLTRVI